MVLWATIDGKYRFVYVVVERNSNIEETVFRILVAFVFSEPASNQRTLTNPV